MWSTSSISLTPQRKETISAIKTLHIFNPEHDYALAVGNNAYTPPASVINLKKRLSLLPALYAGSGDYILLDSDIPLSSVPNLEYFEIAIKKDLKLIFPGDIRALSDLSHISPWGWNHHIHRQLVESGINKDLLPEISFINTVKDLSHRRTSLTFRKELNSLLFSNQPIQTGKEIFNEEEVIDYLKDYPHSYFKAPWSSSGRGVVSSLHISQNQLKEWSHGIIRRQGSVLAEPAWDKKLDFASEWIINRHKAEFLGLSVFETSSRGKYHGNLQASQENLLKLIESQSHFSLEIIEAQKEVLDRLISPYYSGHLGIDMLADNSGNINPCVEINLRLTMGHIYLPNFNPLTTQR